MEQLERELAYFITANNLTLDQEDYLINIFTKVRDTAYEDGQKSVY